MSKYMLLLGGVGPDKTSSQIPDVMEKYLAWTEKLRTSGAYVAAHKLFDGQGRTLTLRSGAVHDGPFVDSKESIGGYYLIEASSLEVAVALARECPTVAVQGGTVEVRPVEF